MSGDPRVPEASVVCLHGLGRSPADWSAVAGGLQAFGSVRAPALQSSPARALEDAAALLEPGAILIGHSLGGVLAVRLASEVAVPLRAVILTDCFFPPARNGRSMRSSVLDYLAHRLAYVRARERNVEGGGSRAASALALASLIGLAARRGRFYSMLQKVPAPMLVVHARDDHHVPLDFALAAAAARGPGHELRILDRGGHHAHVRRPVAWAEAVLPWLSSSASPALG